MLSNKNGKTYELWCFNKSNHICQNIINLPGQHKIKGKLCNSEGLEKIYNLLGDSRLRRWLSYLNEEQLTIE